MHEPMDALSFPEDMRHAVEEVTAGKYESGYEGRDLTILDIGAHVGAFVIWANDRWPGSRIIAYEPDPASFRMLVENTAHLANVTCHNAAVYPSHSGHELFFERAPGDAQAGLVAYMSRVFDQLPEERTFPAAVAHPAWLPSADVIKLDTEGGEFPILSTMDLSHAALIVLEYHLGEDRRRLKALLAADFGLDFERHCRWDPLLPDSEYRLSLAGDHYGKLFFVRKGTRTLARGADRAPGATEPADARVAEAAPGRRTAPGGVRHRIIYARDLLRELVGREMKLRYKRSLLGVAWSLLNPLAQLLVLNFIFYSVLPLDIPNYTAFLFIGLLVWGWFSASLVQATGAIVENRDLIRRPGFPVAILPIVAITSHLLHFVLALPILALVIHDGSGRSGSLFLLLFPLIGLQFLLNMSASYLLAALHVRFRDTQYLLGVLLMIGFYLTPIFYDVGAIPAQQQMLYGLNPMVHLVEAYRAVLMHHQAPDIRALGTIALGSLALLLLGYRLFTSVAYQFVEEL